MTNKKFTYKNSGVDIEAGEQMVESIKGLVQQTHGPQVLANIGAFGGFFKPDLQSYTNPVFVSSVDGVGTKLIVAFKTGIYNTVGQDLVNHCVNDIAVCGADPLFFLDYFSTGKLEKEVGYQIVSGFAKACKENGVALIGGETAEMPDIYSKGEFDLAGTIVGMVDKDRIIDGSTIRRGDQLIGFKSNGIHTNGYSLARNVLFSKYGVDDYVDELGATIGKSMLRVHKSYVPLIKKLRDLECVHGFSHITGGGIMGNTRRILPKGVSLQVDWNAWERPAIFKLIQQLGNVPEDDMRATFNLGIGLIAVVRPDHLNKVKKTASTMDESIIEMGEVV